MKTCIKCGETKGFGEMKKDKRRLDGLTNICKVCNNAGERTPEKAAAQKKRYEKWMKENPKRSKEIKKKYADNNKEKIAKKKSKYYKNNPDKWRIYTAKRRAIVKEAETNYISDKEISTLYASPCFYCGETERITMEHLIPLSRGGRHSIGNLAPMCESCNKSKNDKLLVEWKSRR